jgi:hypothetical protein
MPEFPSQPHPKTKLCAPRARILSVVPIGSSVGWRTMAYLRNEDDPSNNGDAEENLEELDRRGRHAHRHVCQIRVRPPVSGWTRKPTWNDFGGSSNGTGILNRVPRRDRHGHACLTVHQFRRGQDVGVARGRHRGRGVAVGWPGSRGGGSAAGGSITLAR